MRFIIFGTGAVGGVLAGALAHAGADVVAIARGRQLEKLSAGPLILHTYRGTLTVPVSTVGSPDEIDYTNRDVALMTVKSQDTQAAMKALAGQAPPDIPVVCAQNGVANERTLLRVFRRVYGAVVMMPATYVEPGEVSVYGDPHLGTIDLGVFPNGSDDLSREIAEALTAANFDSQTSEDIMRWKYGKLVGNLTNAIEAVCGMGSRNGELGRLVTAEGELVLATAGIDYVRESEEDERRAGNVEYDNAGGKPRRGASSWQSLARGSGSIETDYLNGEIALLGRLNGVPTPANDLVQALANQTARTNTPPGTISEPEILRMLSEAR